VELTDVLPEPESRGWEERREYLYLRREEKKYSVFDYDNWE